MNSISLRKIGIVGAAQVRALLAGTGHGYYWVLGDHGLEKTTEEIQVKGYRILRVDSTREDIQPCGQNAAFIDVEDTVRAARESLIKRLTTRLEEQLPSDQVIVAEAHYTYFKATADFYYLTNLLA